MGLRFRGLLFWCWSCCVIWVSGLFVAGFVGCADCGVLVAGFAVGCLWFVGSLLCGAWWLVFDVGGFDSWFGELIAAGCVTRVGWCGYCWFVCGFADAAGIYGGDFGLDSVARFVWCLCLVVVVSSVGVGFCAGL